MKSAFASTIIITSFLTLLGGCAVPEQSNTEIPSTPNETTMTDTSALQLAPPAAGDKIAIIETQYGPIKVKLFSEQVPEMTKNFEELAKANKYDGTPFHRVVKDFMIQTGDFTNQNGSGGHSYKGPGTELPDEVITDLKHLYGTVSMANRGPNTNGSQFFIVTNDSGASFLNGGYTIFGQVYEGMEVAEKIQNLQVPGTEQPSEEITMTDVTVMPYQPE